MSLIKEKSGMTLRLDDVGWQWKDADIKGGPEQGEITFSDTKWLMYLAHWGPLQVPRITPDYVRKRMSNMWGVEFEFTGKEGRTTVAGHDAVWVEAFGTNHAFYTRFIMWNCPESKRELIADTNYNLSLKTPEEDFEEETGSAKTVRCHEAVSSSAEPELGAIWSAPMDGLSFQYPERWFVFDSPFYVPFPEYDGVRDRRFGSVLGLCSDQNLRVTLRWEPAAETKEVAAFMTDPAVLDRLKSIATQQADVDSIQISGFETFSVPGKKVRRIWGTCAFKETEDPRQRGFFTNGGIFQVAQWDPEGSGRAVSIALLTRQYRYMGATSTPSRSFHDAFMHKLLEGIQ
ncbi:MAG: hypothetical protein HYX75_24135 [Acidobacteria bacterium]|nr:hypothetical protein [Acidobacteriota bacterium]